MAKKFVRGITDVKTINNQDFDTNNVNDLLSDGQYNYIHRKKGKDEEYHNLTDNIKTISSDNTDLLTVTNNNKTTNTATLSPKHDAQKEQVLESTRNTVTINHGTNGTPEKTTVDTNPQKVLEHENLKAGDGLTVNHDNNTSTIKIMSTFKPIETTAKDLENGMVYGVGFSDAPTLDFEDTYHYTTIKVANNKNMQIALKESANTPSLMIAHYRFISSGKASGWRRMTIDYEQLLTLLSQKQDKLTAGDGITIEGQTVDTNPQKVLEHENLLTINGITKVTEGNSTTIGLKIIDNYSGDLNELTETCLVKPTNNAVHLPGPDDGIIVIVDGEGMLTVVKIGDTVSQKYHSLDNYVFTRIGKYFEGAWKWESWTSLSELPTPN